jgi:hypothetical protein
MSIYDGDRTVNGWANVGSPGGSDAAPSYLSLIAHTNDATPSFSERLVENCHLGGTVFLGGPETALAVMQDTTLGGTLISAAGDSVVDRSRIGFMMPTFTGGTATVTNSIIVPCGVYASAPAGLQGDVKFNFCTFDLTHGSDYSTSWMRAGPLSLRIDDSVILGRQNQIYGLINSARSTDSVAFDHDLTQGSAAWCILRDFNGSPGGLTYADVMEGHVKGASVTNTAFVADAQLNPVTYTPHVDSPAVGQAESATDLADYTGRVWSKRRTAGAMEAQWDQPSADPATAPVVMTSRGSTGPPQAWAE